MKKKKKKKKKKSIFHLIFTKKFSNGEIMFITAVVYKLGVLQHFAHLGILGHFWLKNKTGRNFKIHKDLEL